MNPMSSRLVNQPSAASAPIGEGSAIVSYEAVGTAYPIRCIGYDSASGAWFQIANGEVFCQSVDGSQWRGRDKSDLEPVPADWCLDGSSLDSYMPWLPLRDLRNYPQTLTDSVQSPADPQRPGEGPTTTLIYTIPRRGRSGLWCPDPPGGLVEQLRGKMQVQYVLNADGHVIRAGLANDGPMLEYAPYAPESLGKVPVVSEGTIGETLKSYQHFPGTSGQQHFTKEAILALAREKRTGVQIINKNGPTAFLDPKTGKLTLKQSSSQQSSSQQSSSDNTSGNHGTRQRDTDADLAPPARFFSEPTAIAAVITGVLLVVIALIVRWKRAR